MKYLNPKGFALSILAAAAITISSCGSNGGETVEEAIKREEKKISRGNPGIGEPLKTDYFEVTVHDAKLSKTLDTGNEFTDEKAGDGEQYLIFTTSFKNIDDESRMLVDGEVYITFNGKEYKFDKSETVLADGYGLFLDQINPLTVKKTKLVYKVPEGVSGEAFYQPGRADSDQKIFLGKL